MDARTATSPIASMPKLGFLGVGWIGRNRMEAVLASGFGQASAICDSSAEMAAAARRLAPDAVAADTFEALLEARPDGIVIATPSAQHAEQSIRALDAGIAVFCQKPLGRNAEEVAAVVEAARRNDLLLGVDLSYRHTRAMRTIRDRLQGGAIGTVYAADLTFHNAYGPDKPWFYDASLSGGGCVMDLGVHLVDLLLWTLGFPSVETVTADLYAGGRRMAAAGGAVEDFALATLGLEAGATARIACSWRLHAGQDAVISATFHGAEGSLRFSNVGGSFYDFTAEQLVGTRREVLVEPPDEWGGRAAVRWAERLAADKSYDPAVGQLIAVAETLDRIYGR